MGKIKKILENELVGGTQSTDVYPVTSVKAVYDENNERLDHILARRGTVNISTNYNTDHIAEVLTLSKAIAKVPSADRTLGFVATFLTSDGWKTYQFIGDSLTEWSDTSKWEAFGGNIVDTKGNSKVASMSQYAATFYLESAMPYALLPYTAIDEFIQIDFPAKKVKVASGAYSIVKNRMPYSAMVSNTTTQKVGAYKTDFICEAPNTAEAQVWMLAYKVEDSKLYYINFASVPQQMDEEGNVLWYPLAYCNYVDGQFHTNFQGTLYYNGVRYSNTMRDFGNMGGWFPLWQDGTPTMEDDVTVLMPKSFAMYNYTRRAAVQVYFDKTEDSPTWKNTYSVRHYLESERRITISVSSNNISGFYFVPKKTYDDDYSTVPLVVINDDGSGWSSILPPTGYGEYSLLGLYRFGKLTTTTTTIKDKYLPATVATAVGNALYGKSKVGNLQYEEIGEADYNQIILYGQSLSMGWECPEVITTTPIDGNYMVGNNPLINHGNNHDETLHPLIAVKWSSGGEQPIVGCVNSFSKLYRRFVNKNQMFIGSSAGEGGQSIERLSKKCTNASGSVVDNNYYHTEFLRLLDQTKAAVDKESKTVNCSAILYMQGEHNYTGSGLGMTPGTEATKDKDKYKALLMTLKNNMQADIMAKYGQTQKPLFLIYETAGSYINRKDMSINMAQIEFAQENDDVFLLHPTYPTPDYGGSHLSTNGYRWYGELMAKSLYDILVRGEQYNPVFPMNYTISENQLIIDFYVPVPPLVLDTWTKETITNMGFRVYNNDTEVSITDVAVKGTSVVLTCASSLSGTVEVTYAGQGRSGSGNLRDSDTYHSYYTYFDDRKTAPSKRENYTPKDEEGNLIYGKPYPMYNWCANFYHKV